MVTSFFYAGINNNFNESFYNNGGVKRSFGMEQAPVGDGSISRQIPRPLWATFLYEFSNEHQGKPVSIYTLQVDQNPSERASKVPLESIVMDDEYGDKNFVHVRIAPHKFNRGIDFMFFAQLVSVEVDAAGKAKRLIFDGSNGAQTMVML